MTTTELQAPDLEQSYAECGGQRQPPNYRHMT